MASNHTINISYCHFMLIETNPLRYSNSIIDSLSDD